MAHILQNVYMLSKIYNDKKKIIIEWGFFGLIEFLVSESDNILKNHLSALDIGSSHGNHTKIMRDFGLNVDQIDKYEKSAEINSDFNSYNFSKKYDIIFCSHVIEHQRNIGHFLDKIYDTLTDDGSLVISAPKHPAERFVEGHIQSTIMPLFLQNLIFAGFDCLNGKVLSMSGIENSFIIKKCKLFDIKEREMSIYKWNKKHQNRSFLKLNDQSYIKNACLFLENCNVWKQEDLNTEKQSNLSHINLALSLNFPKNYKKKDLMIYFVMNHNEFPYPILDHNKKEININKENFLKFHL